MPVIKDAKVQMKTFPSATEHKPHIVKRHVIPTPQESNRLVVPDLELTPDFGDSAESALSAHQSATFLPRLNLQVKQKPALEEPILRKNSSQKKVGQYNRIADIMNEAQGSEKRESTQPVFSRNMMGKPHRHENRGQTSSLGTLVATQQKDQIAQWAQTTLQMSQSQDAFVNEHNNIKFEETNAIPPIHNLHTQHVTVNTRTKAIGSDFKGELAKEYFGGKEDLFNQNSNLISTLNRKRATEEYL